MSEKRENAPQPRMSPGMKEALDTMYEVSGTKKSRSAFFEKLFAPIPMEAELAAAGLEPQEARFIASQLARNGYAIVKVDQSLATGERENDSE